MMEIDENETSKGDGEKAQEDKPVSKRRLLKKVVIGTAAAAVVGIGAALILKNGLKTSALQPNAAKAVAKTLMTARLAQPRKPQQTAHRMPLRLQRRQLT